VAGGAGRRSAAGHAANAGTNTSGAGGLYSIRRNVLAGDRRFVPDTILGSFDTRNWRDRTDSSIKVVSKTGLSVDVAATLMRM
jgi:hypothetical protein